MACTDTLNTCITQGTDWRLDVTITEDGNIDPNTGQPTNPKNLTGATIELTLKEAKTGSVIATPTVDIFDAENGRVSFTLTDTQTESLISGGDEEIELFGAPKVTYQDGSIAEIFILNAEVHESWN